MKELSTGSLVPTSTLPPPTSPTSPTVRFADKISQTSSCSISNETVDTPSSDIPDDWRLPSCLGNDDASRLQYVVSMWKEDESRRVNTLAEAENISQQLLFDSRQSDGSHWYGTGQTNVFIKDNVIPGMMVGERLGYGHHGTVKVLRYKSLTMARKKIKPEDYSNALTCDKFKEELEIMKKLSLHNHFVKLAGTYTIVGDPKFYILTFPVALCTLDKVIEDYEKLRKDELKITDAITVSLATVGSACTRYLCELSSGGEEKLMAAIEDRLDEGLGCMATAVQWMHEQNIRHLDLKPLNIVLNPGELYITDFDLSRDLLERKITITELYKGHTAGYSAPEIEERLTHSPSSADIYSLGCIFLHIAAVRYDGSRLECKRMLNSGHTQLPSRQESICRYLDKLNCSGPTSNKASRPISSGLQTLYLNLIKDMLQDSQNLRPSAAQINDLLRCYGSYEQRYHARCCKKNQYALSLIRLMKEAYNQKAIESSDSLRGYLAIAIHRQGRRAEHEKVLRAELERHESVYGKDHRRTITAQASLAANLEEQGKHIEADLLRQRMLEATKTTFGNQHPETLRCMLAMGLALSRRRFYRKAEAMLDEAHNLMVDVFGQLNVETLQCLDEWASVLRARRMYKEAEQKHRDVLRCKKGALGDEYAGTLDTMHRLSMVLFDQHKYEEARVLALQTSQLRRKTLGRDHPKTLDSMKHLVTVLQCQGNLTDATSMENERIAALQRLRQRLWGKDPAIHHYIHDATKDCMQKLEAAVNIRPPSLINDALKGELNTLDRVAQVCLDREDYEQAEESYWQALELCQSSLGGHHLTTLASRDRVAMALISQMRYSEAEELLRNNLKLRQRVAGMPGVGMLNTQHNLAGLLGKRGNYAEAERLFRRTIDARANRLGRRDEDTLESMAGLATTLSTQGKLAEAKAQYEDVLDGRKRKFGLTGKTLDTMSDLGCVLNEMGLNDDASTMCRDALKLKKATLGPAHNSTLDTMYKLGAVLLSQKNFSQAEELFRDILTHTENARGKGHKLTLVALDALANVLYHRNMFVEAGSTYRQIIYIRTENLGKEHPETLDSRYELVRVLYLQKRYREAEKMCEEILEARIKVLGEEHRQNIDTMAKLATIFKVQEKLDKAERMYVRTRDLMQKMRGNEHSDTLATMKGLAEVLRSQQKTKEATEAYRLLLKRQQSKLGKEHPTTLDTMYEFAHILQDQGRHEEAQSIFQQIVNMLQSSPMKKNCEIAQFELQSMDALATTLTSQGLFLKAADVLRQAVEIQTLLCGRKSEGNLATMEFLATALVKEYRVNQSEEVLHEAYKVMEGLLHEYTVVNGPAHPNTIRVQSNLDMFRKSSPKRSFSKIFRRRSSNAIHGDRLLATPGTRKPSWMERLPSLDPLKTWEQAEEPKWMERMENLSPGTVPDVFLRPVHKTGPSLDSASTG